MNVSARSYVAAGIAALTAGVIAIPTSAELPAPLTPLSASVQKERVALLAAAGSFTTPIKPPVAFVVLAPPHAVAPNSSPGAVIKASPTAAVAAAAPAAQATLVGFPALQNAIINAYNVINPWVDYGVNLAQYVVGWIPVASFFAPQIGIVYYSLIDPIVTSAVYNTAYVLGGSIGIIQGISNVINDSINAGIGFVNAEINWALSFLPPLPPLPFAAAQTTAFKVAAAPTVQATTTETVDEKHEPGVATSVEPPAKPAADPTEPEAPKSPTQPATETATEPATPEPETEPATETVTPKPEAEPVKKPESTTTGSSGGVAAQGEVRSGTRSATESTKPDDSKTGDSKPDEKTPASKIDDKADKVDLNKPAESSPGTKIGESVGSAHGRKSSSGEGPQRRVNGKETA